MCVSLQSVLEEPTIGYLVGELGGPGSLSEEILSVHVKEQLSSFCLVRTFSEFPCLSTFFLLCWFILFYF